MSLVPMIMAEKQSLKTVAQPNRQAWDLQVQYLKGVGEKLSSLLAKADIRTFWDLLLTLPRCYEDRRKFSNYDEMLQAMGTGQTVLGRGVIEEFEAKRAGFKGRRITEGVACLENSSHRVRFTFFNDFGGSLSKRFPEGTHVIFRGKPQAYKGALQFVHPDLQSASSDLPWWELGWVPIYREVQGISTKTLRKIVGVAFEREEFKRLPEALPASICKKYALPPLGESLRELHFPKSWEPDKENELRPEGKYYRRVVFEELFMMALALHLRRAEWRAQDKKSGQEIPKILVTRKWIQDVCAQLPYSLTQDQKKSLEEIFEDLSLSKEAIPMHRLIQGDVGSGKTIVAFLASLAAIDSGYQAALMAPTEILADQHFQNFCKLFPERAHEALLLKGALTVKAKKEAREALQSGRVRFVIGTQALLTETTIFERLGLVIVDEQHRFGVEQRLGLKDQNTKITPHLLVMTATPIPRSLALTLYGDLSLSMIKEKPAGRKPIATHLIKKKQRPQLQTRVQKFLDEGRQIYIVYPLVEESEELDLKDVQTAYKEWKALYPKVEIGLLHGRMKSAEKDALMRKFKAGDIKILISTTVIEVGVDVPNASVIIIEHAERFGLSQLHQLRGRVGRGSEQSYCVLVGPDFLTELTEQRLKTMVASDDGFYIAEKDLDIRGPGEFLGRRQSGLPGFRVAHILRDVGLMESAREEARVILEKDPKLVAPEHRELRLLLEKWWQGRMELTLSG